MQAKDKLMESAFFLNELENSLGVETRFRYYLSAFLTATYSVLDILLYDFAEKFGLPFKRDEFLSERDFLIACKALGNNDGIEFLKWLQKQKGILSENPLWEKRKFTVHRGTFGMNHDFSVIVSGASSTLMGTYAATQHSQSTQETSQPSIHETNLVAWRSSNQSIGSGDSRFRPPIADKKDLEALHDQVTNILDQAEGKFWTHG